MASYKHHQNLVDLLNQIQVPTTTTSQDLNAMIGFISRELTISYSNKDLTKKGKHHNDPLHITVDAKGKRIPMVLIDDGSALNMCPLKTTSCLGLSIKDFVPTDQHVRAYDNSRREVLGTITLELIIGPMIKKVEFQVLNITSCFNMLLGRPWIHDIEAIPSSLYKKVQFLHEGAIVTIYDDTLTIPKPIFGIDSENEPLTLNGFEIEKLGFGRREEEVERIPMDFAPYSNNNVVAMIRRMNYLLRMNLGKTMKKAIAQVPIISTTTPPFGLGYKPTDDDLLEMEVRRMACAKAKAKGLPCLPEPLKPYTPTLNGKFVKAKDSQHYWGFPGLRFDPESRTIVPGFKLLFDYNKKLLELKKEDTNWVPTDWTNYMDLNVMTTLLGDAICNIEEEEYWEACQHALKRPYKAKTSDEDEERGEAPSDSDKSSNSKSDSDSSNDGNGEDDSNSDGESNKSEDYDSPQIWRLILKAQIIWIKTPWY